MRSSPPAAPGRARLADALALVTLACLGWLVLGQALRFPLVNDDDRGLLESASQATTPFRFFVGDWGLGNHAYRPLHSVSVWATYTLFGDSPFPAQFANLALHLLVCGLLWRLLQRVSGNRLLAWVLTAAFVVSPYTRSPATWVSDRPTLFVALSLVGALSVLRRAWLASEYGEGLEGWTRRSTIAVLGCSLVALLSKESGILVPLLAGFTAAGSSGMAPSQRRLVMIGCVTLVAGYVALRLLVFGGSAAEYAESGVLFGVVPYRSSALLSPGLRLVADVDTVARNLLATVVRVFNPDGSWLTPARLVRVAPAWGAVVALVVLCWRRPLTFAQRLGLAVVVMNAVLHYALFRFRIQYLAEMGLALFVAGTTITSREVRRRWTIVVMAAMMLVTNARFTRAVVSDELRLYRSVEAGGR